MPKNTKKQKKGRSLRTWVLCIQCALLVLVLVLLWAGIFLARLPGRLSNAAIDLTERTVSARAEYLQYNMAGRWCSVDATIQELNALYDQAVAGGGDAQSLYTQPEQYNAFLLAAYPLLRDTLRNNAVTGAFLVLRTGELPAQTEENLPCLYVRDMDPLSSYTAADTDLLLEIAPVEVMRRLDITTSSNWHALAQLSTANESDAPFFAPYRNAVANPGLRYTDLACWTGGYQLTENGARAIAYSVPLISGDGTLYGVLGVDITLDYLTAQLPAEELTTDGSNSGTYLLCIESADGTFRPVVLSGGSYRYTAQQLVDAGLSELDVDCLYLSAEDGEELMMTVRQPLALYNANAPAANEKWVLYGVQPERTMFALTRSILATMLTIVALTTAACLLAALALARGITKPVARMERQMRRDTTGTGAAVRTGIVELDNLADAVQGLNARVRQDAGKLTRILELSSNTMGAFELDARQQTVFCSKGFFWVFGLADIQGDLLNFSDFVERLDSLKKYELIESRHTEGEYQVRVFELDRPGGAQWVRLKLHRDDPLYTGMAEDVTREWQEIRKLEFERDHDALTGIMNRRAFKTRYHQAFASGELKGKVAALLMLDLDNLKYVNDTYGHDSGDAYIRAMARALVDNVPLGALAARISGDEFEVFLVGHDEAALRRQINTLYNCATARSIPLGNGQVFPLRASAGVAWYPRHTADPELLRRYADFAMYSGKHQEKGRVRDFDPQQYSAEAYLLEGSEALNQLIEQQLVNYHFQPLVDARTGKIFGYEMLMRPLIPSLASPLDVLALARRESRLGAIERLSWFCGMEAFVQRMRSGVIAPECKVFINSISSQSLSAADRKLFQREYGPWMKQVVCEHTEEDPNDAEAFRTKEQTRRQWGIEIALDDIGSGYNSESMLLKTNPDYIKLDKELVHNIHADEARRQLLLSLVSFARQRGIRVVAEGVECREEMETLVAMNVDYFQGYYFGRPTAEPAQPNEEAVAALRQARCRAARGKAAPPAP